MHFLRSGRGDQVAPCELGGDAGVGGVHIALATGIGAWLAHPAFRVQDWLQIEVATSPSARGLTEYATWKHNYGDDYDPSGAASLILMFGAACGQRYLDIRRFGALLLRIDPYAVDLVQSTLNAVDDLLYPVLTPWRLHDMAVSYLWYEADTDAEFLAEACPDMDDLPEAVPREPSAILDYLGWAGPSQFAAAHPAWALPPRVRAMHALANDGAQAPFVKCSSWRRAMKKTSGDAVLARCLRGRVPSPLRAFFEALADLRAALAVRRRHHHCPDVRSHFPEQSLFLQACADDAMQHWVDAVYEHQCNGEGVTAFFAELPVQLGNAHDIRRLHAALRRYVDDLAKLAKLVEAMLPLLGEGPDAGTD